MADESASSPGAAGDAPAAAEAIAENLQAGAAASASAAEAIQHAAQTATDIAAEIHKTDSGNPADSPVAPPASAAESAAASHSDHDSAADHDSPGTLSPELHRLLAIEVPIIVQLGIRKLSVGEVMRFAVGAIIEFQKSAEEELELLANNRPIGRGHAVKVGENFGLKLTAIRSVQETIRSLGTV